MKFKFSLDRLMRHRKTEVDIAQKDFADARSRVIEQEEVRARMIERLNLSLETRFEVQKRGGAISEDLSTLQTFIEGQKSLIGQREQVIAGLNKIAEEKREILVQHLKNLKTLEKLKEKRWNEYKRQEEKREMKRIDDIVVTRFGISASRRKGVT